MIIYWDRAIYIQGGPLVFPKFSMLFYGLIASALELVTSINKKSEKFAVVKTCVCALNFGKTHTCVRPEN